MACIVYRNPGLAVIYPAPGSNIEAVAAKDVPSGAAWVIAPDRPSKDHDWQNGAWVYVAPPVQVPDQAPKLALVRAMRKVTLAGAPAGAGDTTAWDIVKAAIDGQGGTIKEDWDMAISIPRLDPSLNLLLTALIPVQATREAIRDAVFVLAGQIDRGEVAP